MNIWELIVGRKNKNAQPQHKNNRQHHKQNSNEKKKSFYKINEQQQQQQSRSKKPNKSFKTNFYRKCTAEEVASVAEKIFGGNYFCVGDSDDSSCIT